VSTTTFNPGDKIKATHNDTGEEATIIAESVTHEGVWQQSTQWFYGLHSWTLELIEAAKPPLPTTPGLYGIGPGRVFSLLDTRGRWYTLDFTAGHPELLPDTTDKVERWADRLKLVFDHTAYSQGLVSK
jgi:hypothetical protein